MCFSGVKPTWYPEYNEIVRLRTMGGITGNVLSNTPGRIVQIQSGNMTFEVPIWDIEKVNPEDLPKDKPPKKRTPNKTPTSLISDEDSGVRSGPFQTTYNTIDLRGMYVKDAVEALERDLETKRDADVFYVVHGRGTGTLRSAVRQYLKTCKLVRKFEDASDGGCTIASLWT